MSARLQSGDADGGKHIVSRRHDDEIHVGFTYRRGPIGVCGSTALVGQFRGCGAVNITHSNQPGIGMGGDGRRPFAADTTGTHKQHPMRIAAAHAFTRRTV
jgi:hypothetical protein